MKKKMEKVIDSEPEMPCLDFIRSGMKLYEGRLAVKILEWNLYPGKRIIFYERANPRNRVACLVEGWEIFNSFAEAYDKLKDTLIPSLSRAKVIEYYEKLFPNNQQKVVAIKLRLA